jgi:tRNA pseudouridine38-40 synthase
MEELNKNKRNLKFTLSWKGSDFFGYQIQAHGNTVQGVFEDSWKILTKEDTALIGCSRLDSGVSSYKFIANLKTFSTIPSQSIPKRLNGIIHLHFNKKLFVSSCDEVSDSFNARHSSLGKHYRYRLWLGKNPVYPQSENAWKIMLPSFISPKIIKKVLKKFEGTHDFSFFRAKDCCANSTRRTINKIEFISHSNLPELLDIHFWGNGFLKQMIRYVVGTSLEVIKWKIDANKIDKALKGESHDLRIFRAPAKALVLKDVFYSKDSYKRSIKTYLLT